MTYLPEDSQARKDIPITSGVLDYFPNALVAVAQVSKAGNDKHNPGEPLHWSREKSTDHADCVVRHVMQRGEIGKDGIRHSAEAAWRALALLEEELIAEGATPGRGTSYNGEPQKVYDRDHDLMRYATREATFTEEWQAP